MMSIKQIIAQYTAFLHRVSILGLSGAIQGALGKLSGRVTIVALKNRPGFFVRANGSGSDLAVCHQVFGEREYAYACSRNVETIVDAGANIGCSAVYFSEEFPRARIFSIEPSSGNFELLRKNTCGIEQVECIKAALWPRTVELEIIDRGEGAWSLQVGEIHTTAIQESANEHIPGITLQELRQRWNLPTIDILKVDIEGGERDVFEEGAVLLEGVNVLIVETHDRWRPGCTRVVYEATRGFDYEWNQGENIFFCREGWLPTNLDKTRIHKISTLS